MLFAARVSLPLRNGSALPNSRFISIQIPHALGFCSLTDFFPEISSDFSAAGSFNSVSLSLMEKRISSADFSKSAGIFLSSFVLIVIARFDFIYLLDVQLLMILFC